MMNHAWAALDRTWLSSPKGGAARCLRQLDRRRRGRAVVLRAPGIRERRAGDEDDRRRARAPRADLRRSRSGRAGGGSGRTGAMTDVRDRRRRADRCRARRPAGGANAPLAARQLPPHRSGYRACDPDRSRPERPVGLSGVASAACRARSARHRRGDPRRHESHARRSDADRDRRRRPGPAAHRGRDEIWAAGAEIGRIRFAEFSAWLLCLVVHLLFLTGFKNRVLVLAHWTIAFLSSGRSERVITEQELFGWRGHRDHQDAGASAEGEGVRGAFRPGSPFRVLRLAADRQPPPPRARARHLR